MQKRTRGLPPYQDITQTAGLLLALHDCTPESVKAARESAGLTQAQAAKIVGLAGGRGAWWHFERTDKPRRLRPCDWAVFLLATGQHPACTAIEAPAGR